MSVFASKPELPNSWNVGNLAFDPLGNLYAQQYAFAQPAKISPDGVITNFTVPPYWFSVTINKKGDIYVFELVNPDVSNTPPYFSRYSPGGTRSVLAGGTSGYKDGTGTDAQFNTRNMVADDAGNVYMVDFNRIRKISPPVLHLLTTPGVASPASYFSISGISLTAAATLQAPASFEFSLNAGGPFSNSLNVPPVSGEINAVKVYVRLAATAAAGTHIDSVSLSSAGTVTQKLAVTGVVSADSNPFPVANAGSNVSITLPTSFATLDASASYDPNGSIVQYYWYQTKGPVQATIADNFSAVTAVTGFATAGTYEFGLQVKDNDGALAYAYKTITVSGYQPPVANAGSNVTLTAPVGSVPLDGSASTGNIVQYYWYQIQGPTNAGVNKNLSTVTFAYGLVPGTYLFGLQVKDNNGLLAYSTKTIVVNPGGPATVPACVINTSPTNGATLPMQATQSLFWQPSAGATSYDIYFGEGTGTPTRLVANITGLGFAVGGFIAGRTYSWYIAPRNETGANTACATDYKSVFTIASANQPTTSNAGSNVTITLPESFVTLDGSASTGNIVQYYWYQAQGAVPFQAMIGNNFSPVTNATGLTIPGTYIYVLQVIDNNGVHAYSQKSVTVKAAGTRVIDASIQTSTSLKTDDGSSLPSVTAVISPNPVPTGQLAKLQINSNKTGTVLINTISSNGKTIDSKKVNLVNGVNTVNLNTSGLAQGFHIINIAGADKPLNVKLVVQ